MGDEPPADAGQASGIGADQHAAQKALGGTLSQQGDICKGRGQCQKHVSRPQNIKQLLWLSLLLLGCSVAVLARNGTFELLQRLRSHCYDIGSQDSTPDLLTATLSDLRKGLDGGHFTSHDLVKAYMARNDEVDDKLHAVIETNPHAMAEAVQLDNARANRRSRGALHGIPILLKDSIATARLEYVSSPH